MQTRQGDRSSPHHYARILKKFRSAHPDVIIYALRLDRGPVIPKVLRRCPVKAGTMNAGLNDHTTLCQGRRLGEIMNNSFV